MILIKVLFFTLHYSAVVRGSKETSVTEYGKDCSEKESCLSFCPVGWERRGNIASSGARILTTRLQLGNMLKITAEILMLILQRLQPRMSTNTWDQRFQATPGSEPQTRRKVGPGSGRTVLPSTLSLQREAEAVPTLQLMDKAPTERNAETN